MADPIQSAIAALARLPLGRCVGGEPVEVGLAQATRAVLELIEPADPHLYQTDPVPPVYGASSSYVEGTLTYASSIDAAITNLKLKYCYNAGIAAGGAQGALPVICLMHAYAGDYDNFTTADMRRYADYGFVVFAPGMRGRNGAGGLADSGGREPYDVLDGLAAVRAALPTIASQSVATAVGYSGGGGIVHALAAKSPDTWTLFATFFGISDYGYDEVAGWWFTTGSSNNRAQLTTEIGVSRFVDRRPYRARNHVEAIPRALASGGPLGGYLYMLHDSADGDVEAVNSTRVAAEMAAAGLENYFLDESQPGQYPRWLHALPSQDPQLLLGEPRFVRRGRAGAAWALPVRGSLRVCGWVRVNAPSFSDGFEIWLGPNTTPRTDAEGGVEEVADVEYDCVSKTYLVTPLTNATMWVQIAQGYQTRVQQIVGPTEIELNAPSNAAPLTTLEDLPGCIWNLRADQGIVLGGADVASWADQAGSKNYAQATAARRPLFEAAFESHAAVSFDASNTERLDGPVIVDPSTDYTLMFMMRATAADAEAWAQCNSASLNKNWVILRSTTTVAIHSAISSTDVGNELNAPCSTAAWHMVTLAYSARLGQREVQVDLATNFDLATPANFGAVVGTDRSTIGCLCDQPGFRSHWSGRFRELAAWQRYLTQNDRTLAYTYLGTTWGGLPPP